ncbi:hypothetical protein LCGC14_1275000 [marine sediment metagenome]|uniref:Uncharacterized protein n=1 Tax=marine sediment metagenome TaxID=412755 RepID=A0A0F9KWW3_9ZZZZ
MSKYTKGPWKVANEHDGVHAGTHTRIYNDDGMFIAKTTVQDGRGRMERKRVEANAQLISAAPELLEACKTMLVATDFNAPLPKGHSGQEAYLNVVAKPRVEQAIAKAEGLSEKREG